VYAFYGLIRFDNILIRNGTVINTDPLIETNKVGGCIKACIISG